ncbi:MAG: hypothetical protein KBD52_02370 [Candidatus Pacebacteria bacterium]|nr:hypothetical protein [Candidatus Paceibacterota bacterium]
MTKLIVFNPLPFLKDEDNFKLVVNHFKTHECTFGTKENPYYVLPKVVSTKNFFLHSITPKVAIALGYNLPVRYNYHWSTKPEEDEREVENFFTELKDSSHGVIITLVHFDEQGTLNIFQEVEATPEPHVFELPYFNPQDSEAFIFKYYTAEV